MAILSALALAVVLNQNPVPPAICKDYARIGRDITIDRNNGTPIDDETNSVNNSLMNAAANNQSDSATIEAFQKVEGILIVKIYGDWAAATPNEVYHMILVNCVRVTNKNKGE